MRIAYVRSSGHSTLTTKSTQFDTTDSLAEALRRMRRDDELVTQPARRTLAAMAPGFVRPPVLQLAPNVRFLPTTANDEKCVVCEKWFCDGNCGFAPVPSGAALKVAA